MTVDGLMSTHTTPTHAGSVNAQGTASLLLDGADISVPGLDPQPVRRRIGMVFQTYNLFPHMTALENAMLAPRRVKGLARAEAEPQVAALFERFNTAAMNTVPIK